MKYFVLTVLLAAQGSVAHAAGSIRLANTIASKVQWAQNPFTGSVPVPTTPGLVVYGVFWGTNRDHELTLALPLGSNSTVVAGMILAPGDIQIPGTEAYQTVYLQIKAWPAAYGTNWSEGYFFSPYGETDIRQVRLAGESGPGTIIWQSSTGTDPSRFYPLILDSLVPRAWVQFLPGFLSATVDEGNHGTVDVVVSLIRQNSPGNLNFTSSVRVSTTNLTAMAGEDYLPTNALVVFGPGEIFQTVRIKVTADPLPEPTEQFGIRLLSSRELFVVTIQEARVNAVRREAERTVVTIQTTGYHRYTLESSPDLLSWSTVPGAENIAGWGGPVEVADPSPDCCGPRFYRTRLLP